MRQVEGPLRVEILAYAPTAFYHCAHCEVVWQEVGFGRGLRQEQIRTALPPDVAQTYQTVSDWIRGLVAAHGDRIAVRMIDAASVEGFVKSLRYGLRRYPAVVVDGRRAYPGADLAAAGSAIAQALSLPAG